MSLMVWNSNIQIGARLTHALSELSSTDPRSINYDPFHNYPDFKLSQLPLDMPLELKHQFRTLLPYVAINQTVKNLFYTSRQSDGTLVYHGPVQNRPWEWTEYLGDDNPDEFRNSGSLPLELFDARLTGDHLLDSTGLSERDESFLRSLRNDMVSESIFERDWREGRIPLQASTPPEFGSRLGGNEEDEESSKTQRGQQNSRGASPASSIRSRISAASFRSPSVSSQLSRGAGSSDVIEVDSLPSTSSTQTQKRKATRDIGEDDDDEIQIIDNPDPSVFKKKTGTKGKSTASKSRGKKR